MKKRALKTGNLCISTVFIISLFHCFEMCRACSVFCIDKRGMRVTGRSYDWSFGESLIIVNKRGQTKTAFTYWSESRDNLATWTSKYGSVTFVQYGREIAFDGMNEAGLVVSELWLDETVYPTVDSRPSVSLDQYVQYILDNFKTVDEIIGSDAFIRLRPVPSNFSKVHFFAADSSGNCIVVEFLNGQMVYHAKNSMPVEAITNNTYESSINYIHRGIPPNPNSSSSLERFYRISTKIEEYDPDSSGNVITYAFKMLDAVKAAGGWTKFQAVFDIKNRIVYFKSHKNWQFRFFRFDAFDYSCQTPSKMLDVNANLSGDVTDSFSDYDWQANEAMIKAAWEDLGSIDIYLPALQMISRYPESFVCEGINDIGNLQNQLPAEFELHKNFSNPFNPSTLIHYSLGGPSYVMLTIYNMLGQKVKKLVDSYQSAGNHSVVWNGTDKNNNSAASGVYFCRLNANKQILREKMFLIR
jgi:penicillin V acylase-like amidase (Ntn superfamily)